MMNILSDLSDIFYPRVCHICGSRLADGRRYICDVCRAHLPRTGFHAVPMNLMEQRLAGLIPFERAAGHFYYHAGSSTATLIKDLKYHKYEGLGIYLGQIAAGELQGTGFLDDIDMIVPVPMHWLKEAKRGYNQAQKFGEGISSVTGIPICNLLTMPHRHSTQTRLGRTGRISNTQGIFRVKHPDVARGKHLLLIDDVCTTGSTLISAVSTIIAIIPDVRITIYTIAVAV